jgi:HemY protein
MNAPPEADWSDLDPEGRAFAYQTADWARLVITYAETGELIHPRHERRERALSELPELPIAYADAAAFLSPDGGAPVLFSLDEEGYEDEESTPAEPAPPPGRRRRGASRLASAPRAAK